MAFNFKEAHNQVQGDSSGHHQHWWWQIALRLAVWQISR